MIRIKVTKEYFLRLIRDELKNCYFDDKEVIDLYMQRYERFTEGLEGFEGLVVPTPSIDIQKMAQEDFDNSYIIYKDDETSKYDEVMRYYEEDGFDVYIGSEICDFIEGYANDMFLVTKIKERTE